MKPVKVNYWESLVSSRRARNPTDADQPADKKIKNSSQPEMFSRRPAYGPSDGREFATGCRRLLGKRSKTYVQIPQDRLYRDRRRGGSDRGQRHAITSGGGR